jgi:hypothetical protein
MAARRRGCQQRGGDQPFIPLLTLESRERLIAMIP